jgi:hypothetical protein
MAGNISLNLRHGETRHVAEGHHLGSFDGDPVYQSFFPQAIQRGHNRDIGAPDAGAVTEFAYGNTVRLLPHGGQKRLFQRTKPDFARR